MSLAAVIAASLAAAAAEPAPAAADARPQLSCELGPLHKSYGGSPWLVYGCNDGKSLVFVLNDGHPDKPFIFFVYAKPDGQMALHGEGTAPKAITDPAYADLTKLSAPDIAALHQATQTPPPRP